MFSSTTGKYLILLINKLQLSGHLKKLCISFHHVGQMSITPSWIPAFNSGTDIFLNICFLSVTLHFIVITATHVLILSPRINSTTTHLKQKSAYKLLLLLILKHGIRPHYTGWSFVIGFNLRFYWSLWRFFVFRVALLCAHWVFSISRF